MPFRKYSKVSSLKMLIRFCSIFANSLPRCAPVCFRCNHHHYLSQTIFEPKKEQLSTNEILSNNLYTFTYMSLYAYRKGKYSVEKNLSKSSLFLPTTNATSLFRVTAPNKEHFSSNQAYIVLSYNLKSPS